MHHADDDATYQWPTCTACPRHLWADETGRQVCGICQEETGQRLADLPALFRRLNTTAALTRGARRTGGSTSGSKTPPIPPRLEVLALVGPGGVAARLQAIEDSWRTALRWKIEVRADAVRTFAPWRTDPQREIPRLTQFLGNNLLWACSSYESVGQDIADLKRLHGEMKAIAADERQPGRVQIGRCPNVAGDARCGADLTATAATHRIRCGTCGTRWETLGEWRELRAAQEQALAEAAGVAA
ncbi:hypothetical protein OG875_04855 [Streptomyces sp. NBC_01498]|uniref:hypothetical protein n=1 Tax=Streptomyces sp. NBC_01498 TaxID=2975870 RepID=UPI002E7AE169|nr:hypothetical protein [Streptomyces sp. NBC_01498]WTL23986.1 hypothetical protein OG875_04855 [Streptomyces sp. NBC_01498]